METHKDKMEGEQSIMEDIVYHKTRNVIRVCSECGKTAKGIDEINVLFGFRKINYDLQPYTLCKECREKQ